MKTLLRNVLVVLAVAGYAVTAHAQTYTWNNAGTGAWSNSANWTPARTTPAATDTLVFDGATTPSIVDTGLVSQTVSMLTLVNGARVVFNASVADSLKITGALSIDATSSLIDSANAVITIALQSGATGSIAGTFRATGATVATAHKITAATASALSFESGSVCRCDTLFTGNVFGGSTGTVNSVIFKSGSLFSQYGGSNPFAATAPNSIVLFQTGSTFRYDGTGFPSYSGRTYANIVLDVAPNASASTGASAFVCDNFTVNRGTPILNLTTMTIKGNITVAAGATLTFGSTATVNTLNLAGSAQQTLSGAGTLVFGPGGNLTINNASGVVLGMNTTVGGTLTFTTGNFTLGSSNLALKKAVVGAGAGKSLVTNGSGAVQDSIVAGGTYVFPVSANGTDYTPLVLKAGVTDPAELYTVSVASAITPAFSDNALTVQRMWNVAEGTTGGNNATMSFVWPESIEGAGFTRASSAVWNTNGGSWIQASAGKLATGNPDTLMSLVPVTSFGSFTVANGVPIAHMSLPSLAFGKVSVGGTKKDSVAVKNTGVGSLTVSNVLASDTAFTVTPKSASIAAGDSAWFSVTFAPVTASVKSGLLIFTTDGASGSENSVTLSGTGVQSGITIAPSSLAFGKVWKDSTRVDSVHVTNSSASAALVVDSVKSSNPLFVVTPSSATIDTMGGKWFVVAFSPLAKGTAAGTLVFYHNASSKQDTVLVSGTGIVREPLFSANVSSIDFKTVQVGQFAKDSVTVKNTGTDSLFIGGVVTGDTVYSVTPTSARLDTGATAKFFVTFTPKASGVKASTIVFTSNASEVTDTVKVTGTGNQYISIAAARALPAGSTVSIQGVITRAYGAYTYLQQDSAAIVIYQGTGSLKDSIAAGVVKEGTTIALTGKTSNYNSLIEIASTDLTSWTRTGSASVPAPVELTLAQINAGGSKYQARLIKVKNLIVVTTDPIFLSKKTYNIKDPSDSTLAVALRIGNPTDTWVDSMAVPAGRFTFVGPLGQFNSSDPTKGFQLMPIDSADVKAIPYISIAAARALPAGSEVWIQGVATRSYGAYTYLQQDSAAIVVYQGSGSLKDSIAAGAVAEGAVLSINGKLSVYNSLLEIASTDILSWSKMGTAALPTPVELTLAQINANGSKYQSQLIKVRALTLVSTDLIFLSKKTYNITDPTDTTKAVALRIGNPTDTRTDSTATPTGKFMFVGVLGQFNSSDPTKGFQLMPIDSNDIASNPTGISEKQPGVVPQVFALHQNYPNPFNPSTTIEFALPTAGMTTLTVYNVLGQEIATLMNEVKAAGTYQVRFNASGLPSGMYIYRIQSGSFTSVRKMLLLK